MNIREINKKVENFLKNYKSINEILSKEDLAEFELIVNNLYDRVTKISMN